MESFTTKYNYQRPTYTPHKLERSIDEIRADVSEHADIKNTSKDFQYQYGSGSIIASNISEKNNNLYDVSEVNDQTAIGLSALNLTKVELSLGIYTDSATVTSSINKQLLNVISNTLEEFHLDDSLNSNMKAYTEGNMLEYANALINKGALEITQQGGNAKALDDYLYAMSSSITDAINDIKSTLGNEIEIQKDEIFGLETIPTLRVWQEKDVMVNVVSQTFNITNSDGDIVEIKASYDKSQSIQTDDFLNTNKLLNVEITKGSLDKTEQAAFNQFLDDFSKVTNAILAGDETLANETFNSINPEDYGFESIKKVRENTYDHYDNEEVLHIYNEELEHNSSSGDVRGRFNGTHQDQSYIKGGELHGLYRNSVSDLSEFDIKFANTHAQSSSGVSTPVTRHAYDFSTNSAESAISGLSQQYGKRADGIIIKDNNGQLYRYEFNSEDRSSSGWRELNSERFNLEKLQLKEYFNKYQLEIINDTGQVMVRESLSGDLVTTETKLATQENDNHYGQTEVLDQDIFEDKLGNLYQYTAADKFSESGWIEIENTSKNRELMELRQQNEVLHKYLQVDQQLGSVKLSSMINKRETYENNNDLYLNMKISKQ